VRRTFLAAAVLAGAVALAATAPAVRAQSHAVLANGETLFHIGGCTNCHTARGGGLLAGGDPIRTPFGTFHPPNITPDPETGIGGWSEADFLRAMRDGRAPDGTPYYPAFPYTSYHLMTDPDLRALWAYLRTLPPVRRPTPDHELGFPYNLRFGLYLWQWLFHEPRPFEPDPARDEVWNRGAYLVLGPGHCAECHTPRNWFGALDRDRLFAGNPDGPGGDEVPNITGDPERGIGSWSLDQLVFYLKIGMRPDGDFAGGEMAKVIENGTSKLSGNDRLAIATYLKSLPPAR
jgi:mono/diheme cytochrome c family protein